MNYLELVKCEPTFCNFGIKIVIFSGTVSVIMVR